ncbi:hypothetical protein [Spirulina sp. 06S082]|uniref:hypothetical protein n=1 Tax=Spirulina sp. 06S082 TaxID=3110248 RepID=UPI002B20B6F4|nr:hypothetical protein [Spirulina sp. 06S082]MEA5471624.1 hypothetical protein [Spirulina sp. 06S082]
MRATWMVLLAIAIGLTLLQNWSPSLSLILFGSATLALPLAVWLGLGLGAGIATSLLVQLLNYRPPISSSESNPDVAPRYRDAPRGKRRTRPPGKSDWEVPPSPDWDPLAEDDGGWDIDEAPSAATIPQTNAPQSDLRKNARTIQQDSPPRKRPPQPESQSPPTTQDPPESKATPSQAADGIYDANYRVITPPDTEESQFSPEEEKNWDF